MCTYSALPDGQSVGQPNDFHLAHHASRAAGGLGLVLVEATGVKPEGRISPFDLGIWSDGQVAAHRRRATAITSAGAVAGIQLAHAGRKASIERPWLGGGPAAPAEGGWVTLGPSAIQFPGLPLPGAMTLAQVKDVADAWGSAARRALEAGYEVVEVHAAHGYLLLSFLSPLSNTRTDAYGGSPENRARIALEAIDAVRAVWPAEKPVFLRISSTDWVAEDANDDRPAWTLEDSTILAGWAHERGVDLIDTSSGGLVPANIPHTVDYQSANAAAIKNSVGDGGPAVAAVGRITDPIQAAGLIADGSADAVFLGRAFLRDASWANNAAAALDAEGRFIKQYDYAV